jgi:hypothetical protein
MSDEDFVPGRWFGMVFRSPKAERVEQVLATLRVAEIPLILEEEDPEGVVHVLAEETPLGERGLWSVFVPEASLRLARRTLRKLPFRITTDPKGSRSHGEDARRRNQVILWTMVLLAAIVALVAVVQVWRGEMVLDAGEIGKGLLILGGVSLAIGLPILIAWRDSRRWLRARRRRFVPAGGRSGQGGSSASPGPV